MLLMLKKESVYTKEHTMNGKYKISVLGSSLIETILKVTKSMQGFGTNGK